MTDDRNTPLAFAVLGFVQGTILLLLLEMAVDPFDGLMAVPVLATCVVAPMIYVAWSPRPRLAVGLALALALAIGIAFQFVPDDVDLALHFAAIAGAIALPAAVGGRVVDSAGGLGDRRAWAQGLSDRAAWADGFWLALLTVLAAGLFTLFCWLLIALAFLMLEAVGLDLFDLLSDLSDHWWVPVTTVLVGLGAALLRRWSRLLDGLRGLVTAILTWPMVVFGPLLALVAGLMLIGGLLAVTERMDLVFGVGTGAVLVLIPAFFAAGTADPSAARPSWLLRGLALLLPVLTVTLLLTEARLWFATVPETDHAVGLALIAMTVPIGFLGLRALAGTRWSDRVVDAMRLGLPLAALVGAILWPLHARIDAIAADTLADRLRASAWDAAEMDIDRLAYRYGEAGEAALRALAADPPAAWPAEAAAALERLVTALDDPSQRLPPLRLSNRAIAEGLPVSPVGASVPDSVLTAIGRDHQIARCETMARCGLIAPAATAPVAAAAAAAVWQWVLVQDALPYWAPDSPTDRVAIRTIRLVETATGTWAPDTEILRIVPTATGDALSAALENGTARGGGGPLPLPSAQGM